uniref:Uncharacterized protein n=1 Tax=Arundo donax TaxID=35708 RepID=A0A0A9FDC4_ARUDO
MCWIKYSGVRPRLLQGSIYN